MKTPKPPKVKETPEQKQQRKRAEIDNVRAIQETVQQRTSIFRRQVSPRISLVNGTRSTSASLM